MGLPPVIPSAGFCSCSNLGQERPPSTFTKRNPLLNPER